MRDQINEALKDAIRAKDEVRVAALRLVLAAIKERDIASRSNDRTDGIDDQEILGVMAKMIKQRQESASMYEEAGRLELAERERAEIEVIEDFLPKQLSQAEVEQAVRTVIDETDATGLKDMGKVMASLKERYAGQMDFAKASGVVKSLLIAT